MTQLSYCAHCGAMTGGSSFCSNCGAQSQQQTPTASTTQPVAPEPTIASSPQAKSSSAKWWWITGAAVLVVGAVVATFVVVGSGGTNFADQAATALAPALDQNKTVALDVASLKPSSNKTQLHDAFTLGSQTIATAKAKIDLIATSGDDQVLQSQLDRLLDHLKLLLGRLLDSKWRVMRVTRQGWVYDDIQPCPTIFATDVQSFLARR